MIGIGFEVETFAAQPSTNWNPSPADTPRGVGSFFDPPFSDREFGLVVSEEMSLDRIFDLACEDSEPSS